MVTLGQEFRFFNLFQAHRKMYLFQLRTVREDAGLRFLHAARNMYMSASVWTYQIDEYL